MAKKEVRNVSNQSLYVNLPALPGVPTGRSVKLRARGITEVDDNDLDAPAMQFHISRGTLIVVEKGAPEEALSESALVQWIDIQPLVPAPAAEPPRRRRTSDRV